MDAGHGLCKGVLDILRSPLFPSQHPFIINKNMTKQDENELNMHKARKIISSGKSLSKKEYRYDVPADLERYMKDWDEFVSISRYKNKPYEKHIMIAIQFYSHKKFIHLDKPIVEALIKAWRKYK